MDLATQLERLGVPRDLVDQVRKGTMMQDDYTRKRQQESERLRALEMELAYMKGQQTAAQGTPKSEAEQFLASLGDGEQAEAARKLLLPYGEAIARDVERRFAPQLQQVTQNAATYGYDAKLEAYLRDTLVPMFGEGVREHWPELKQQSLERLMQGQHVIPEALLLSEKRDVATKLLVEAQQAKTKEQAASSMEGFAQSQHTTPAMSGAFVVPDARSQAATPGNGIGPNRGQAVKVDPVAVWKETALDLGIPAVGTI